MTFDNHPLPSVAPNSLDVEKQANATIPGLCLDGRLLSQEIIGQLKQEVQIFKQQYQRSPGLGIVLVGHHPASLTYVRNKQKRAQEVGMHVELLHLSEEVTTSQLLQHVKKFNHSASIDGFIVQLPLPSGVDSQHILENINPAKDVDALHSYHMGQLLAGRAFLKPCTAMGIMALLHQVKPSLQGLKAVVVGRSAIVGKPVALLLLAENVTVTLCHSYTQYLHEEIHQADIVVAACGVPELIQGSWIKPGAIVIDVGIHKILGQWKGDVQYKQARQRASYITPVPGGVGPMTVAMLLHNVLLAANKAKGSESLLG